LLIRLCICLSFGREPFSCNSHSDCPFSFPMHGRNMTFQAQRFLLLHLEMMPAIRQVLATCLRISCHASLLLLSSLLRTAVYFSCQKGERHTRNVCDVIAAFYLIVRDVAAFTLSPLFLSLSSRLLHQKQNKTLLSLTLPVFMLLSAKRREKQRSLSAFCFRSHSSHFHWLSLI